MSKRLKEINSALATLQTFKGEETFRNRLYAIEENIIFLKSIKSFPSYLIWLFRRASKIDASRLLELTDFPVPEWDIKMHERLIEIQRRDKPGLIKPLVDALVTFIQGQQGDVTLADFGAGGMEIERQMVLKILAGNYSGKVCIVGIDKSSTTQVIAKKNLASVADSIELVERETLDEQELDHIKKTAKKNIIIVLCKNDIFDLPKKFSHKYFTAVYHSLFRHHLTADQQDKLDVVIHQLTNEAFEFDGFRSFFPHLIIQSFVAWKYPVFLDDTVFSMLRYKKRAEVSPEARFFMNTAHYLLHHNV